MRTAILLLLLTFASSAFAGKTLFCKSNFTLPGSDIAQDAAFFYDEAWLSCKDIKGRDFTAILSGAGLSFRYDSSLTIISCPFLPKKKIRNLNVLGVRVEASAIVGGRIGLYVDPKYLGCILFGGKLGLGLGTVLGSFEILPGPISDHL